MKKIKIKTPAKINLTLEILNRRDDGFHNIQSIMQAINLYDYLTFEVNEAKGINIKLDGNSKNIPYNEDNLIYKAAVKFFNKANIKDVKFAVYIEKNIPAAAGLAGGSTNAAGTLYALNKLYNEALNQQEINEICASMGSDINFCLQGGCALCTSRGENIEALPFFKQPVSLIKPKNLGINTKEAYINFSHLKDKTNPDHTSKMKSLLLKGEFDKSLIYNSLEKAVIPYHEELQEIKSKVKNSLMSGSGSTFFVLDSKITADKNKYDIFENLSTINTGAEEVND